MREMTMATVIERVRAGATYADTHIVGWAEKVDCDRFDMAACSGCVIGQTLGDYNGGRAILGMNIPEAASLGFHAEAATKLSFAEFMCLPADEKEVQRQTCSAEYAALRSAWLHEIALRLETPAAEEARIEALPEDVGCVWGAL